MNPNSSSLGVDVTFLLVGATALAMVTPVIGALLRWRKPRAVARSARMTVPPAVRAIARRGVDATSSSSERASRGGSRRRGGAGRAVRRDRAADGAARAGVRRSRRMRAASARARRRARAVARARAARSATHVLSAPLEAHLQLTNRCDAGCKGCYTGASPEGAPNEWGLAEWKRAIDALADAGVFHVALGGGESAVLPWLGELADHARARGIIPNLTTSGLDGLDRAARDRRSVRPDQRLARRPRRDLRRGARLRRLRARRRRDPRAARGQARDRHQRRRHAPQLRRARRDLRVRAPSAGSPRSSCCASSRRAAARARTTELRCTDAQHRAFLPDDPRAPRRATRARQGRLLVHADARAPSTRIARCSPSSRVYGCTGGDFLVGAKPGGQLTACSFAVAAAADRRRAPARRRARRVLDAPGRVRRVPHLARRRRAVRELRLPRAVPRRLQGRVRARRPAISSAPDPECPRVVDRPHRLIDHGKQRVRLPVV